LVVESYEFEFITVGVLCGWWVTMESSDPQAAERNSAAAALVSEISSDLYGAVSSSVYETARLVTLAPWLAGHSQRVLFLLQSQGRGGNWGGLDGYGLVPTLSATEALLASLRRWRDGDGQIVDYADVIGAADRGLRTLFGWLGVDARVVVPDTIAAEIVVPALVAQVNVHLDGFVLEPVIGLDMWRGSGRLLLPPGVDDGLLARLGHLVRRGHALPTKVLHSLEALGSVVRGADLVHPVDGAVGCSPAATAAWLWDRGGCRAAVGYLEAVQSRGGGPVPGVTPITVFERTWVLAALTAAGIGVTVPHGLVGSVHAEFGECGVGAGPGLPSDSDDTAVALYALAQVGSPRSLDCLLAYQVDAHFSCFPDERTPSVSTNAHVLQTFGRYLEYDLSGRFRCQAAMGRLSGWLRDSQREDGSWGRWSGTYEETAYAVQTLLQTHVPRADSAVEQAAARGCVFLQRPTGKRHPEAIDGIFRADRKSHHMPSCTLCRLLERKSLLRAEGVRHAAYRRVLGPSLRGHQLQVCHNIISHTVHAANDALTPAMTMAQGLRMSIILRL
jgi:hypothetical protein